MKEPVKNYEKFGDILRLNRNAQSISQTRLASLINEQLDRQYTKSNISKWENGYQRPDPEVVEDLEDILGILAGVLLSAAGYHDAAEIRRLRAFDSEEARKWGALKIHIHKLLSLLNELVEDLARVSTFDISQLDTEELFAGKVSLRKYISEMRAPCAVYDEASTDSIALCVETNDLWACLKEHLKHECPGFDKKIADWKRAVVTLVKSCRSLTRYILRKVQDKKGPFRGETKGEMITARVVTLIYRSAISHETSDLVQHQSCGNRQGELIYRTGRLTQSVAQGGVEFLEKVQGHCSKIADSGCVQSKIKRIRRVQSILATCQEAMLNKLGVVLECSTFAPVASCPICKRLM